MQLLDPNNIKKIEDRIASAEIADSSLSVDLVDHICCMIEERLDLGISIEEAEAEVFKEMGEIQLKSIELETKRLTQNKFIMKKRTKIIGLVTLLVILTGLAFKLLHLPGAGILWGLGILIAAFGFFVMVLVDRFQYEKSPAKRTIVFVGYVGAAALLIGMGMAFLHWPFSSYIAEIGGVLLLVYFILTNSVSYTNDTGQ